MEREQATALSTGRQVDALPNEIAHYKISTIQQRLKHNNNDSKGKNYKISGNKTNF